MQLKYRTHIKIHFTHCKQPLQLNDNYKTASQQYFKSKQNPGCVIARQPK